MHDMLLVDEIGSEAEQVESEPELDIDDLGDYLDMTQTQKVKAEAPPKSQKCKFNHKGKHTQNDRVEEDIESDSDQGTDPGMVNLLSQQNQASMKKYVEESLKNPPPATDKNLKNISDLVEDDHDSTSEVEENWEDSMTKKPKIEKLIK